MSGKSLEELYRENLVANRCSRFPTIEKPPKFIVNGEKVTKYNHWGVGDSEGGWERNEATAITRDSHAHRPGIFDPTALLLKKAGSGVTLGVPEKTGEVMGGEDGCSIWQWNGSQWIILQPQPERLLSQQRWLYPDPQNSQTRRNLSDLIIDDYVDGVGRNRTRRVRRNISVPVSFDETAVDEELINLDEAGAFDGGRRRTRRRRRRRRRKTRHNKKRRRKRTRKRRVKKRRKTRKRRGGWRWTWKRKKKSQAQKEEARAKKLTTKWKQGMARHGASPQQTVDDHLERVARARKGN